LASSDWTIEEDLAIINDYFNMLKKELTGEKYVKAEHRRNLLPFLNNRSHGSVERKHMNISAVLIEKGLPYIAGYKPYHNYQDLLKEEIENYLSENPEVFYWVEDFLFSDIQAPEVSDILQSEVAVPKFDYQIKEPGFNYSPVLGEKNYYKQEIRNKKLGLLGEEFIINYEKKRLINLGLNSLSKKIEHVAQTVGDSAGFDILSFNEEGKEKFIEVKTTQMGKDAPFYFSRNQLEFSQTEKDRFSLYRVFNFKKDPKFYKLRGSLEETCFNHPTEFLGWPR